MRQERRKKVKGRWLEETAEALLGDETAYVTEFLRWVPESKRRLLCARLCAMLKDCGAMAR